jgi:hypothetical protein
MEGGLSDRALKVLRAVLHEKANVDLAEMPDPALVADQISLFELTCERACGPVTLAEIRNWIQQHGYELRGVCCRRTISADWRSPPHSGIRRRLHYRAARSPGIADQA